MDGVDICQEFEKLSSGGVVGGAMATVWKQIKPARLREDAMRLALLNGMRRMGTKIKADFEKTTATWKHKPKFEVMVSLTKPGPTVVVDTNDEIYRYVNDGTEAHVILPKKAKALRFPGTFTSKTVPGVLEARQGSSGGGDVFAKGVLHPGTKARNFDKMIARKWQGLFKREMEAVMRDVAIASGHALR